MGGGDGVVEVEGEGVFGDVVFYEFVLGGGEFVGDVVVLVVGEGDVFVCVVFEVD